MSHPDAPDMRSDPYDTGLRHYSQGRLDQALASFRLHLESHPRDARGHINIGVILEARGRLEAAAESYLRAVALNPQAGHHVNIGCVYRRLRHLGHAEREAEQYAAAIRLDPNCADAWYNLAGVRIYQGRYDDALKMARRAIALNDREPRYCHTLALGHFFQGDHDTARHWFERSCALGAATWDAEFDRRRRPRPRRWFARPGDVIERLPDDAARPYGRPEPNVLTRPAWTLPSLSYRQQRIFQVQHRDVYVEGLHGIVYDDADVFSNDYLLIRGNWRFFTESPRQHPRETIRLDRAACLHPPDLPNYYHWTAECLCQLLLLGDLLGRDETIQLLAPPENGPAYVAEHLDLLGFDPARVVRSRADRRHRYQVAELHYIDWQRPLGAPPADEIAAAWYPPRALLRRLRRRLAEPWPAPAERRLVIYTSRADPKQVRRVDDEPMLIDALRRLLGEDLVVFTGHGQAMRDQIGLFRRARLVLGPHGAGLTNALYCAPGTALIEFPVVPPVLNFFGHLAMALDLDYWLVPEVSTHYQGNYTVGPRGIEAVVRLVRHLAGAAARAA